MFEHFSEIDLHIVELPVEVQDGKPVYQGFIQEFPYMQAIANSKRGRHSGKNTSCFF